jgi:hypothetical protein
MFSIIVCSINSVYLEQLKLNLNQTLGQPYELLVWDNLTEQRPITEVYNMLATRAQYPYWCFIHEDIRFETMNWALNLRIAFDEHPETGLIGIAGAKYKSRTPSGWSTGLKELDYCNIYHQDQNGLTQHIYMNPLKAVFEPVVNMDGVFIVIRREVWNSAHFNEENLRGFHLYDIDFSFHVVKHWKAAVIFNIDIMHFTQGGNYGDAWLETTLNWHLFFSDQLPQPEEKNAAQNSWEKKIGIFWLKRLSVEEISWKNKWKWIQAGKTWQDPMAWPYIGLFLFGSYIKAQSTKPKA